MSRSPLFAQLCRAFRIAHFAEHRKISTPDALELVAQLQSRPETGVSRRTFLADAARTATAGAVAALAGSWGSTLKAVAPGSGANVGIVGAGLAGLVCADTLRKKGLRATIYEASSRVGGRCGSLEGFFPGQVAERGGEFIDNPHKTMLGYANQFRLTREDLNKEPGEVTYFVNGQHHPEATVVDEYRRFVAAIHGDLRSSSGAPTADDHTDADVALDRTSLLEYLEGRNSSGEPADPVIKSVIISAYEGEYGLAVSEQSCLNFILFIHADKRSKFTPFGIFSDERWHIVEGNGRIAEGLASLLPGQIEFDHELRRVRRTAAGAIELTLKAGARTITRVHDAVVLTVPFSVLRNVALDPSLGLPPEKTLAIQDLGYGTNAKTMIGFSSRPWVAQNANGAAYADLANVQVTWETNPASASPTRAILTDYASGARGAALAQLDVQMAAGQFLVDLDLVLPGASLAATRVNGQLVVHREHWPSNPLAKGSYTCYRPGQFTTIAGNEGKPVGNLHFAGEHTNSFYEWQGFMEGACLSGVQAATEILEDIKRGRLG